MATEKYNMIADVLEADGVEWLDGGKKMWCPHCDHTAITAMAGNRFAQCWHCETKWRVPANPFETTKPLTTPLHYLMDVAAKVCLDCLPQKTRAMEWLCNRRGLPRDAAWLRGQDVGAVDASFDYTPHINKAYGLQNAERERLHRVFTAVPDGDNAAEKKHKARAKIQRDDALAELEEEITLFRNIVLKQLNDVRWSGCIAYVYRDQDGVVVSLNLRDCFSELNGIDDGEQRRKIVARVQVRRRGVFGAPPASTPLWGHGVGEGLVVTEGEHNTLSLRAHSHEWGPNRDLDIISIGGKHGSDHEAIQALATGDGTDMVIYDHDEIEPGQDMPGGYDLVRHLSSTLYLRATTTPGCGSDLDSYLTSRKPTASEFLSEVLLKWHKTAPSFAEVGLQAAALMSNSKLTREKRTSMLGKLLVDDIQLRAELARTNGHAMILYTEPNATHATMVPVRKGDVEYHRWMAQYDIHDTTWLDIIAMRLNVEATIQRKLVELAEYVDKKLYVNNFDGSIVRLDPEPQQVVNGTDGVWMQQYTRPGETQSVAQPWYDVACYTAAREAHLTRRAAQPYIMSGMRHRPDSLLDKHILSTVRYGSEPEIHKQLIKGWILSLFFQSEQKARPAIMFEAPGAAGKSTVGTNIGHLILGEQFSVQNAPSTPAELAEKMSDSPLALFDDWDEVNPKVEARFRVLSTGGVDVRRELYTTSQTVTLQCRAAVMVTSNYNPNRAAATSRRVITIPIVPRQGEHGEAVYRSVGTSILPRFREQRKRIWGELLLDLASIVYNLPQTDPDMPTSYSMSDFGVFVERCASVEGWAAEASAMFTTLTKVQEVQAADHNFFANLLPDYFADRPQEFGLYRSARDWCDRLIFQVRDSDMKGREKCNKFHFSQMMRLNIDLFTRRFGLLTQTDKHTKVISYAFLGGPGMNNPNTEPPPQPLETISNEEIAEILDLHNSERAAYAEVQHA